MSSSSTSRPKNGSNSAGGGSVGSEGGGNESSPSSGGGERAPVVAAPSLRPARGITLRANSIRFRHEEPEWHEDSSYSGDSLSRDSCGMEVLDLRPSDHHAVRHLETSSLVSLGSKSGGSASNESSIETSKSLSKVGKGHELTELKFSKLPSSLFNVASGGGAGGGGEGDLAAGGEGEGTGPPPHWEEANGGAPDGGGVAKAQRGGAIRLPAKARTRSSLSLRISNNGKFLLGESEEAYKNLMSLMSGRDDEAPDDRGDDDDKSDKQGSHRSRGSAGSVRSSVSGDSRQSGFWSELGSVAGSETTETSPLTRQKRRHLRREMVMRRCAQALAAGAAIAALCGSAIYFGSFAGNAYLGELLGKRGMGERTGEAPRRKLPLDGPPDGTVASSPRDAMAAREEGYYQDAAQHDELIDEEWIDQDQEYVQEYPQGNYQFHPEGRRVLDPGEEDNFAPQGWF